MNDFVFTEEDVKKVIKVAFVCNLNSFFVGWLLYECFLTESEVKGIAMDESSLQQLQACYMEKEELSVYTPEEFNDVQGLMNEKDIVARTCEGRLLCIA